MELQIPISIHTLSSEYIYDYIPFHVTWKNTYMYYSSRDNVLSTGDKTER